MTLTRRSLFIALGTLPLTRAAFGQAGDHAAADHQAAHRLTVLHMNDFHSRHEAVDGRALACDAGRDGCFGGSARLATAIKAQRAAAEADGRAVLLLDAGDQFQGSLFYTAHHGMAELAVMHAIGTDAMAVGNHEFDNGPGTLGRFADAARFPVLSANVDATAEPALMGRLRPYALFDRAGLRIAVVGLTTTGALLSSSPGPNVRIGDATAALATNAAAARTAGANMVIALSHLGVAADGGLDVPGVGVILGGHSHTLLSNVEPGALGPHPVVSPSGALVVQAGAYGRHIGLDLAEDPAVAAIVAQYAAPLQEVRRRRVAVLPEELGVASCRMAQCAFGQLVAGALLAAAHGADVAIMNGGGLRTGLRAGAATLGDVLNALPFGNSLATVTLTGADLRAAIEHGLGLVGRGGFPQLAGVRLEWSALRPAGDRITQLEVRGPDGASTEVDPGRRYLLATNSFIRGGGDGYTVLRDRGIEPYDAGPDVAELVAAALTAGVPP